MSENDRDELQKIVTVNIQPSGKTSPSYAKRKFNIDWIESIDKRGLAFDEKEMQILMKRFDDAELYIQLPGKESARITNTNSLDFRPVLFDTKTHEYFNDISFVDIWESLDRIFDVIGEKHEDERALLAALLYRMAFMDDHVLETNKGPQIVRYVDIKTGKTEKISKQFPDRYVYSPNIEAIKRISKIIPKICGMELDKFLNYLELLIWNEDCKYYDRKRAKGKSDWYNIGRINTIKTIIIFIGARIGFIPLLKVFKEFGRQGIAKPDDSDVAKLGGKYIIFSGKANKNKTHQ